MRKIRCAIYTRKSSEEGLDQEFNSLHAQREACAAYIASQKHEGWIALPQVYDDGGISGGTLERPALQRLLIDIDAGLVDQIVVYKIDRLTRSLADFAKLVERLDAVDASFVSVTQSFNTATSMGRLTLNVLLSFAQFEREVTAERIRDKIAASKRKGLWMGGNIPLGYEPDGRTLRIVEEEAQTITKLYDLYLQHGTIRAVKEQADILGLQRRRRSIAEQAARQTAGEGQRQHIDTGDLSFGRGHIYYILSNPIYAGRIRHHKQIHEGQHPAIIDPVTWDLVQQRLTASSGRQRSKPSLPSASRSLLAGKLYDENGDRLTPSHTNKHGKRYRYYVSHRLIDKTLLGDVATSRGWRLPARALEAGIAGRIINHLRQQISSTLLKQPNAETIATMRLRLDAAAAMPDSESTGQALECLARATIRAGQIDIVLDPTTVASFLASPPDALNQDALSFTAPFQFRKRGVEARLIIGDTTAPQADPVLIRNIARAHRIYEAIKQGQPFDQIAGAEGISSRRMMQLLDLAFLAPDIVKMVIQGRHPPALTSARLELHPLPSDWQAQRELISCF